MSLDAAAPPKSNSLQVVKGLNLNSIFKGWGMAYHKGSARFLLDRISIDKRHRRCHPGWNLDDLDDELDDERGDKRAVDPPSINVMLNAACLV